MQKTLGYILAVGGLIGVIYFTIEYMQDSETFELLGADIAVSTGDWVPILVSALVMVVGVLMSRAR